MDSSKKGIRFSRSLSKGFAQRIFGSLQDWKLQVFLLNLLVISPLFLPSLLDLGQFDEMVYLNSGRSVAEGALPSFAANPLLAFFYAIPYQLVQNSPLWIVKLAGIGRFFLFCALWIGAYLVAREFKPIPSPMILLGIVFGSPVFERILLNPSDALFTAVSSLSFWQLLRYKNTQKPRALWLASLLLGLAALSRSDGVVIFPIFIILSLLIASRQSSRNRTQLLRLFVPIAFPFILIVAGYIGLRGLVTSSFDPELTKRSYIAFEQGQELVYRSETGNPTIEAQREARRLYGTREENGASVLNAIRHNPSAYFGRLRAAMSNLPALLLDAYDKRQGALIFLFAAFGIYALIKEREFLLLAMVVLWPLHLTVYFLTFFREGYLYFIYFILFSLCALGIFQTLARQSTRSERFVLAALLLALSIYGVVDNKLAITGGTLVFLVGLPIIWSLRSNLPRLERLEGFALLSVLSLALVIRADFPSITLSQPVSSAESNAVVYLTDHFEPGSRIVAYAPGFVDAAKMDYVGLVSQGLTFESSAEFHQWLLAKNIKALLSTSALRNSEPELTRLIEATIGHGIDRVFREDPHDVQILVVEFD